jgi:hypothetical protein
MKINNEKQLEQKENKEILGLNQINNNDVNIANTEDEANEKLETKGLKLKKSTKERLNEVQSNFEDAESMVLALLNQYEAFRIETESRYSDRKAEIDKFNYLMDSIKNSFLNSLDMAAYMEEKCMEKLSNQLKKRDKTIMNLQQDNEKLRELVLSKEKEVENIGKELMAVKDSFSRVNFALTTVEKELKDKSEIMQNSQKHLISLTEMVEEGKMFKEKCSELSKTVTSMQLELKRYELTSKLLSKSEEENVAYKEEIKNLKEELKNQRDYNNSLNKKIQDILVEKSEEIIRLRDEFDNNVKVLENDKKKEIQMYNDTIDKLKEEMFNLRLNKI